MVARALERSQTLEASNRPSRRRRVDVSPEAVPAPKSRIGRKLAQPQVVEDVEDDFTSSSEQEDVDAFDEPVLEEHSIRPMGALPPVPRTGHVEPNIRRDIRLGRLVNLRKLIREVNIPSDDREKSERENKKKLPIGLWHDAFLVFFSIRVEAHPHETQGMIRHMQLVRQLQRQGKDGVEYDLLFRECKVNHPSIQWGEYLAELTEELQPRVFTPWARRSSFNQQSPSFSYRQRPYKQQPLPFRQPYRQQQYTQQSKSQPPAYPPYQRNNVNTANVCSFFNTVGCARFPCLYKHSCSICGSIQHGKQRCRQQAQLPYR